ncbi:hypothetical protein HJO_05865 [Hyphomonas johnsonii MHS-2]|jgi:hypothetical protein|uniref:Uncharacterized protein n=2 Tax=Hyphomonas johnsonii TaxID=81031 RepID=A0A059FSA2_9PROT|nr:hypothetical protein HJO_05865 [Hyphomonas johnsonii MHS-2]
MLNSKGQNMKKVLLVSAALLMAPLFASAESTDEATINLAGNVEQICTVIPWTGVAGANGGAANRTYTVSGDTVTFDWDFLINNTDDPGLATIGQTSQAFFSIAFDTFCNDNFTWTTSFTNGGMLNTEPAPAGFTNNLGFNVTIKQIGTGGQGSIGGSAASGDKIYASPAFIGRSQIDFNVVPSTTPPIAGDYAETVTLTFAADT